MHEWPKQTENEAILLTLTGVLFLINPRRRLQNNMKQGIIEVLTLNKLHSTNVKRYPIQRGPVKSNNEKLNGM